MSFYGAFSPYPRRYGGGKPLARLIFERLVEARGSALNAGDPTTFAYVDTVAVARAIAAAWATNGRLRNLWDMRRTCLIERWEKILLGATYPNDPDKTRRDRLVAARERVGVESIYSAILAEMRTALGDLFVAIEHIPLASAVIHRPAGSYPWGTVHPHTPWACSIAKVLVLVTLPEGRSEAELRDAIGVARKVLDDALGATMRFHFYRAPQGQPAIAVAGGPSKAGIYCDTPGTLDNNVFGH